MPRWRNWQTRWTQNPVLFTGSVGSTPTRGTINPHVHISEIVDLLLYGRTHTAKRGFDNQISAQKLPPSFEH